MSLKFFTNLDVSSGITSGIKESYETINHDEVIQQLVSKVSDLEDKIAKLEARL